LGVLVGDVGLLLSLSVRVVDSFGFRAIP